MLLFNAHAGAQVHVPQCTGAAAATALPATTTTPVGTALAGGSDSSITSTGPSPSLKVSHTAACFIRVILAPFPDGLHAQAATANPR